MSEREFKVEVLNTLYCIDVKEQTSRLSLFKQDRNVLAAPVPGMIAVVPHRTEGPGLLSLPSTLVSAWALFCRLPTWWESWPRAVSNEPPQEKENMFLPKSSWRPLEGLRHPELHQATPMAEARTVIRKGGTGRGKHAREPKTTAPSVHTCPTSVHCSFWGWRIAQTNYYFYSFQSASEIDALLLESIAKKAQPLCHQATSWFSSWVFFLE